MFVALLPFILLVLIVVFVKMWNKNKKYRKVVEAKQELAAQRIESELLDVKMEIENVKSQNESKKESITNE